MSQGIKASLVGIFLTLAGAPELQASGTNNGGGRGRLGPTGSVSDPSSTTGSSKDSSSDGSSDYGSSTGMIEVSPEELKNLCNEAGSDLGVCGYVIEASASGPEN